MIISIFEVLVGAFVLFVIATTTYGPLTQRYGWLWVVLVGLIAFSSMLVHCFVLGSTINPPVWTTLLFGMTLAGLSPKKTGPIGHWYKRGIYGVAVGTFAGWAFYV